MESRTTAHRYLRARPMTRYPVLHQSWKILPVPEDPAGRPEGSEILEEHPPYAPLLFRLYRALRSRGRFGAAAVGVSEEEILAEAIAIHDHETWETIRRLCGVCDPATPNRAIAAAAEHLAVMLAGAGHPHSAAAFSRAAAAIQPGSPLASYRAARAARDVGHYSDAEIWFDRAIILARQQRDWKVYVRAYLGYGRTHLEKGSHPNAERSYKRALRRARRERLWHEMAMAAHELMVIERFRSDYARAREYAEIAIEGYGERSSGIMRLGHDVGYGYLETGRFADAAGIFGAIIHASGDDLLALLAKANLCRAHAGLGDEERFRALVGEVLSEIDDHPIQKSELLLEIAVGARSLGDYERSRVHARAALRAAEEHAQNKSVFRAQAVLDSLREPVPVSYDQAPPEDEALVSTDALIRSIAGR